MWKPAKAQSHEYYTSVLAELFSHYQQVMELSSDGMFIYLDNEYKLCNQKLACLWGYSQDDWSRQSPYLQSFIAPDSQFAVALHYIDCKQNFHPVRFQFLARKKDGSVFNADKAMTPVFYKDEFFILNLVKAV